MLFICDKKYDITTLIDHNQLYERLYDDIYEKIVNIHGNLAQEFIKTTPANAEVVKYYCNVFNSTRIIFANMIINLTSSRYLIESQA